MKHKEKNFTDINQAGWIASMPKQAQPYLILMRADRPIGVWLLLFPSLFSLTLAYGIQDHFSFQRYLAYIALFSVGAFLMRSAGCVINDLWDQTLDKKVERTADRPLASGALSNKQAIALLFCLLGLSLVILCQFNPFTILLGVLSIIPVIIYPLMKRITDFPQLVLGLTFNWGALMGWGAIMGQINLPAIYLYCFGILWTLGYDTIYAYQDIEDDQKIGVRSTALFFQEKGKQWVGGFYLFSLLFLSLATQSAWVFLPMLHFIHQIKKWNPGDQLSSLTYFKSNKTTGWLVLLCIVLSTLTGY